MSTENDLKIALEQVTKSYEETKQELKKLPDMEKSLAALEAQNKAQQAELKKSAERKSLLEEVITGNADVDRKLALGGLVKGLVAHGLATSQRPDAFAGRLNKDNEMSCKTFGYSGAERELAEHMMNKAAASQGTLDSSGGVFISHEVLGSDWIKKLRPNSKTIFDAGAQWVELPAGTGALTIPRQKSLASAAPVDENGQLTQTELQWEYISASPRRAGASFAVSKTLLYSASQFADIAINELLYGVEREVQNKALYGTGASGSPRGLFYDPLVAKVYLGNGGATSAGSAGKINTYLDINLMEDLLGRNNGRVNGFSVIALPQVVRNMKNSIINSNGTFSLMPEGTLASDDNLKKALGADRNIFRLTDITSGATVGSSTDCSHIFFGQFDQITVPTWGGIMIKTSDTAVVKGVSMFESNLLGIAADVNYDVIVKQPYELFVARDARTASA